MNDKELADKVVALGIGNPPFHAAAFGANYSFAMESFTEKRFVRDWRVAGACFEALDRTVHDMVSLIQSAELIEQRERNWPRAIIEACAEGLGTV